MTRRRIEVEIGVLALDAPTETAALAAALERELGRLVAGGEPLAREGSRVAALSADLPGGQRSPTDLGRTLARLVSRGLVR